MSFIWFFYTFYLFYIQNDVDELKWLLTPQETKKIISKSSCKLLKQLVTRRAAVVVVSVIQNIFSHPSKNHSFIQSVTHSLSFLQFFNVLYNIPCFVVFVFAKKSRRKFKLHHFVGPSLHRQTKGIVLQNLPKRFHFEDLFSFVLQVFLKNKYFRAVDWHKDGWCLVVVLAVLWPHNCDNEFLFYFRL